jgi:hypothetical protein
VRGRVYLLPDEPGISLNGSTSLPVDEDGRFVRERLTPGRYRLVGEIPAVEVEGGELGALDIRIPGADVSDVRLVVSAPRSLAGRVHLDAADDLTRRRMLQATRVILRRVGNGIQVSSFDVRQAPVDADGAFVVNGLLPGDYDLTVDTTLGADLQAPSLESIDQGGSPLPDGIVRLANTASDEIAVHLSIRPAELSGVVRGWTGGGVLSVLVFPEDPVGRQRLNRVRLSQVQEDGRYHVQGLLQGNYLVAAVSGVDLTGLLDVATLEEATRMATPVRLGRGEARQLDLQIPER